MSLYPSLEDMQVDQLMKAQGSTPEPSPTLPYPVQPNAPLYPNSATSPLYPNSATAPLNIAPDTASLYTPGATDHAYPELTEYMGIELTPEEIALNMPEYIGTNQTAVALAGSRGIAATASTQQALFPSLASTQQSVVAPLSGTSVGLARAQVSHGIRQVIMCKDKNGKIGLRVKGVNKGVFVCLVTRGSPAALGGLRFGDQILQINGTNVAGFSTEKAHEKLKKAAENNIVLAVRDRPFERTITLHKDSTGHIGFTFKEGRINAITKDSSAARNGLLIDHHLLEVNGQNVVGLKDKEVGEYIEEGGSIITVTLIPTYIYNLIMKNMSNSLVKKLMDHSVPEI